MQVEGDKDKNEQEKADFFFHKKIKIKMSSRIGLVAN